MIQIGDLVRINRSDCRTLGKTAIVVNKGTWSADVHIIDNGWEIRLDLELLEKL
mgnify:CR=1 FL=1